jgi:hypothetical protein
MVRIEGQLGGCGKRKDGEEEGSCQEGGRVEAHDGSGRLETGSFVLILSH